MPSQSSPDYDSVTASASHTYSKDDLQTIYEIISLATLIPSEHAFRCIWRAYETVLRYRDIDPAHDSKYFRVLINLGGGGSLLDKFRTFLNENGYDAAAVNFLRQPSPELITLYNKTRYNEAKERRNRNRKGDSGNTSGSSGTISLEETSLVGDEGEGLTNASDVQRGKRRQYDQARRDQKRTKRKLETRPTPPGKATVHATAHPQQSSIFQRLLTPVQEETSRLGLSSSSRAALARLVSDSELSAEAEDINNLRLARKYFHHWHTVTSQQVEHRRWLEAQAAAYDRRVLLREAFTEWLFLFKERQTEHARNIYLLGQAFATWAHKTAAIINRSNEMRQRIMARKYFSAWRSIVLENEVKVRKFQLQSALFKWRTALYRQRQEEEYAASVYEFTLAKRTRKLWWYRACESVAPSWHNNFLLREALATWKQQASAITHNHVVATRHYSFNLLSRVFKFWLGRTDHVLDLEEDAVDHAEWSLTCRHLSMWRWRNRCAPLIAKVQSTVNHRLVKTVLTTWRFHHRQSLAAHALLRANTLKHAFRTWNLHLRHNIMVVQIEDRLLLDALYQWVLQTRYQNFVNRIRNWILAKHMLASWRKKATQAVVARRKKEHHARSLVRHKLYTSVLDYWRTRLSHLQALEDQAIRFHNTKIAQRALRGWRNMHVQKVTTLDTWAFNARYYLLCTHHLKQWRASTKARHRHHLRTAFSSLWHARRRRLLHSALTTWRDRAAHVTALDISSQAYNSSRLLFTHLQLWQSQLLRLSHLNHLQETYKNPVLSNAYLQRWLTYHDHLVNINQLAIQYRSNMISLLASSLFRKWRTNTFVIGTRHTAAEMMWNRNEKRRAQLLLKMWAEQMRERIALKRFEEQLDDNGSTDVGGNNNGGIISPPSPSPASAPIISFTPRTPRSERTRKILTQMAPRTSFSRTSRSLFQSTQSPLHEMTEDESAVDHRNRHRNRSNPPTAMTPNVNHDETDDDNSEHDDDHDDNEQNSDDEEPLIDLRTPRPPTRKPPTTTTTHITNAYPPSSHQRPLTSTPSLPPPLSSSTTISPIRPTSNSALTSSLLQTPSARAARARELMSRLTPVRPPGGPSHPALTLPPTPPLPPPLPNNGATTNTPRSHSIARAPSPLRNTVVAPQGPRTPLGSPVRNSIFGMASGAGEVRVTSSVAGQTGGDGNSGGGGGGGGGKPQHQQGRSVRFSTTRLFQ